MSFLKEARRLPIAQAAASLGLRVSRRGLAPCPACGAGGRGVRVFGGGARWHCHRCSEGGDVVDLVAYRVAGERFGRSCFPAVRDWFEGAGVVLAELPEPPPPPPEAPPPAREVLGLLSGCRPVSEDAEVLAWVRSRGALDAVVLCGALPVGAWVPGWAGFGPRTWPEMGYRAIFPMHDAAGKIRSVRARCVLPDPPGPKALPARGYSQCGLVLANPAARYMLRTGCKPEHWQPGWRYRVVVAEGEPAWLAWAVSHASRPVLGIVAGSWTADIAARVPEGASVVVAADRDRAGDRYYAVVAESLAGRCVVSRWRGR